MDAKELIARRIALELKDGNLVNLGIGLPAMVAITFRLASTCSFNWRTG